MRDRKILLLLPLCFVVLLFQTACYKDSLEMSKLSKHYELNTGIGGPIAYGNIRLSDAVKKADKYIDTPGVGGGKYLVRFVYEDTLRKLDTGSFFKRPQISPKVLTKITLGEQKIPKDVFIFNKLLPVSSTPISAVLVWPFDSLRIDTAKLIVKFSSLTVNQRFIFSIVSENITVFQKTITATSSTQTESFDLLNVKLTNQFRYKVELLSGGGSYPTIDESSFEKDVIAASGKTNKKITGMIDVEKALSSLEGVIRNSQDISEITSSENKRIDTILFKGGYLPVEATSTFQNANITVQVLENERIKKDGNPFTPNVMITQKNSDLNYVDFSRVLVRPMYTPEKKNTFEFDLKYTITWVNQTELIFDKNWYFTLTLHQGQFYFKRIHGYAGDTCLTYAPTTRLQTNLSKSLGELSSAVQSITFTNPRIEMPYVNGAGITATVRATIDGYTASNQQINILKDQEFIIQSPARPASLFDTVIAKVDTFLIDSSRSKTLGSLPRYLPEYINYNVNVCLNTPNNGGYISNFIDESSKLAVNFRLVVPMQLIMKDVDIANTFDLKLSDYDVDEIDALKLVLQFENDFPIGLTVQTILLDSLGNAIDHLTNTILEPAPTDDSGERTKARTTTTIIDLQKGETMLTNLFKAKKVKVIARLNTYDSNKAKTATLYTYYRLKFNMGAEIKAKFSGNLK